MKRLWNELQSQLRYQIIIPFLVLTLVVAMAGALVVFYLVGQSLQERFDNQLAAVTRSANDALTGQEQANLQFLREVAFALPNEQTGAPAVAEALARGDVEGLARALDPFFRVGATRNGVYLDRLIAFDRSGVSLVDFERSGEGQTTAYTVHAPLDLRNAPFTERILRGEADGLGDKYAGLIRFTDTNQLYFATIAPVRAGNEIVGGVIAAMQVDRLLSMLTARSQAAGITLYDEAGHVLSSTFNATGLGEAPAMSPELLGQFAANRQPGSGALFSIETIGGREYQFAYVPLVIRGQSIGILAPALSRDYVMDTWNRTRGPIIALIVALSLVIIITGAVTARLITRPLEELAETARAISNGDLHRRAPVVSKNEIGQLAISFNQMTDHLVHLYRQRHKEASQHAAIVKSIPDGIVVVDDRGNITQINPATRRLMGLADDAPMPSKLSDIPMQRLVEGVPGFGAQRANNLYTLGDHIVRASISPVNDSDGSLYGHVCLLQDMTAEVAVDRAKTNFIGTISHELRTPLTVIRGNADLLLRGLAGPLEEDQRIFVESIRQHANHMTSLVNNVIVIANLDAGTLKTELEPIDLARPIGEAVFPLQSQIKAKGLTLTMDLAADLRPVLGDYDHVRQIVYQLLDNARRYTSEGGITIRTRDGGDHVRIEVEDTGRGIPPDMQTQIFERFIRGDGASEGINSSERGIGLGLAICKQLVERQGGTIGVTSTPGKGSTFYFTLRYADDTKNPENTSTSSSSLAEAA